MSTATWTRALIAGVALIAVAHPAAAGPKPPQVIIGVNFASISNRDAHDLGLDYGGKIGFGAGADYPLPIGTLGSNITATLRPGGMYMSGGGSREFVVGGSDVQKISLGSVDIPVLLELRPKALADGRIGLIIGPQFSILTCVCDTTGSEHVSLISDVNRFRVGLAIGAVVELKPYKIDVGFEWIPIFGRLFKSDLNDATTRHSVLVFVRPHLFRGN